MDEKKYPNLHPKAAAKFKGKNANLKIFRDIPSAFYFITNFLSLPENLVKPTEMALP